MQWKVEDQAEQDLEEEEERKRGDIPGQLYKRKVPEYLTAKVVIYY
jgi:hypothetical protein